VRDTISDTRTGVDQQQLVQQLLAAARVDGMELAGRGGLLIGVDQTVLETALEAEMREHRGYAKHDPAGRAGPTCRRRTKTVLAEVGPALIEVARDRNGSVELAIVPKRVRRKEGVDQIVLSLTARRLTTGEVVTHFAVYGAKVSRDTISRITDIVLEVINERLEAQRAGDVAGVRPRGRAPQAASCGPDWTVCSRSDSPHDAAASGRCPGLGRPGSAFRSWFLVLSLPQP